MFIVLKMGLKVGNLRSFKSKYLLIIFVHFFMFGFINIKKKVRNYEN